MQQHEIIIIQLRRAILYALAVFIVTSAVVLSGARIFLPEIQGYKENIEQRLGELIQQNVRIDQVDARLIGFTPTIVFKGVHLIDDSGVKELISFREAHLGLAVLQSLSQHTLVPSNFTIIGTRISIVEKPNGSYSIQGMDIPELGSEDLDSKINDELASWLLEQASISIKDSVVIWKKNNSKVLHRFEKVNVILHNRGERHQLTGSFELPEEVDRQSKFAMDVEGNLLEPAKWHGLVYLNSKGVRFSRLGIRPEYEKFKIRDAITDYELWGEWSDGGFKHLSGDVHFYGMEVENTKTGKISRLDEVEGKFDWQGTSSNWELRIDNFTFVIQGNAWEKSTLIASKKSVDENTVELGLGLTYARIEDIKNLFLNLGLYTGKSAETLAGLSPIGTINKLDINFVQTNGVPDKFSLNASVQELGFKAWKKIPGVYGVNAQILMSEDSGQVKLDGQNIIFTSPALFRHSIAYGKVAGNIELQNSGNGWILQSNDLVIENPDFNIAMGLMLMLPDNKQAHYLDLQVAMRDVNIAEIHKYQPAVVMKEKLVDWIDNSFKSGQIPEINFVYRGWSGGFPFKGYSGVLQGDFTAPDVTMDYFPGWPGLYSLAAKGVFSDRAIMIKSNSAKIHNGDIKNLVVKVDDFLKPILVAKGDAYGSTHDGFHFFSKTPIGQRAQRFVKNTRFAGSIHANMVFSVALDKELAKQYKKQFTGYVETSNSAMYMLRERMDVTAIKGRVYFSDKKHHGEGITARLLQGDAKIQVSSKLVGSKPVMEIMGEGRFDAVMLDRRFKKLGMMRLSGQLPWSGKLTLGHVNAAGDGREPARMWLKSDLLGVSIDLPEPFKKSAEISRQSTMHFTFLPDIKSILSIQYGDRMSTEMRLNNNYFPARIEIGEMKLSSGKAKLPDKDEFRLSGVINNMDQYGWREVMQQHYDKYKKLRTRPIVDVPVIVDFAYVNIPFDKTKAKPRKRYTSPKVLPAFKGQIKRFIFAGKEFGKLEFDSRRDNFGLSFDKVRLTSPHMELNAKATWHYIRNWHRTKVKGIVKTSDLGKLMTNFGFPGKVKDGDGTVKIDLSWKNPFYVFQPGYTNGSVEVAIEDGVVSAINPGAGRFLGLLNLSTLPRRLLLDFSDVGSGFGFDKITGKISLNNGVATSQNMAVDSTVADVLAVGRVDIRKKEFDQIVTVTPQVAGTMPIVSGLLMGTGVIPLVWLFERMFGSDIDKSISRQYHISGPWEKPNVDRIDKEEGKGQTTDDENI